MGRRERTEAFVDYFRPTEAGGVDRSQKSIRCGRARAVSRAPRSQALCLGQIRKYASYRSAFTAIIRPSFRPPRPSGIPRPRRQGRIFSANSAVVLCALRLKAFDRKVREEPRKVRKENQPKGVGRNARASRAPQGAHWKGSARRDFPTCVFLSRSALSR